MTDEAITQRMAVEMATKGACEFHFTAASMLRAVALLQLASRHPGLDDNHRRFVRTFVEHARRYFADCPTVLDVITRGDDPAQDVRQQDDGAAKLFRAMTDRELDHYASALALDLVEAAHEHTRAFCRDRLALIDQELAARRRQP